LRVPGVPIDSVLHDTLLTHDSTAPAHGCNMELGSPVVHLRSPQHAITAVWLDLTTFGVMLVGLVAPYLPTCTGQCRDVQLELNSLEATHIESTDNTIVSAAQRPVGTWPDVKFVVCAAWHPSLAVFADEDLAAFLPTATQVLLQIFEVPHRCTIAWLWDAFAVVAPPIARTTCCSDALSKAINAFASLFGVLLLALALARIASTDAVVFGELAI